MLGLKLTHVSQGDHRKHENRLHSYLKSFFMEGKEPSILISNATVDRHNISKKRPCMTRWDKWSQTYCIIALEWHQNWHQNHVKSKSQREHFFSFKIMNFENVASKMTDLEPILLWFIGDSVQSMMTSSNGNTFRVTGPLCGEFTGQRWIPHTKASDAELWCFHCNDNDEMWIQLPKHVYVQFPKNN